MVFVYVSEAAWGLLFTWQGNGNMFLSCQSLKDRITCISVRDKQTDNIKLNLMESIISEQASFVTCVRVCEEGRNKTLAYSIFPQILPLNHDDKL